MQTNSFDINQRQLGGGGDKLFLQEHAYIK